MFHHSKPVDPDLSWYNSAFSVLFYYYVTFSKNQHHFVMVLIAVTGIGEPKITPFWDSYHVAYSGVTGQHVE